MCLYDSRARSKGREWAAPPNCGEVHLEERLGSLNFCLPASSNFYQQLRFSYHSGEGRGA